MEISDEAGALAIEVSQLKTAMAGRPVIDQAKGMLMLRYDVDAVGAFAMMSRWSMEWNVKVQVLATMMASHCVVDVAELRRLATAPESTTHSSAGQAA